MKRPISLMIIIFIIALIISYKIYYHFTDNVGNYYVNNDIKIDDVKALSNVSVNKIDNDIKEIKEKYIGIIDIPKIKLKRVFYNINSSLNDVNKNIMVLKGSKMPNIKGGTLFLAAHSGNSNISFFRNIDLLNIDDEIMIYYNNKVYFYIVSDSYETVKNGKISINKNINENILVLTTCSKNKDKQLIVVSKLVKNM